MSTTSDPTRGPSTSPAGSESDVSMRSSTSRQRLLKAKSKIILDSDEEMDDPAVEERARRLKRLGKMKAVDTPPDSEEEEDPIQDPVIRAKIDALVANAIAGLSKEHPYLEAIASDNENPRLLVLGLYLALIKADALQQHGICKYCFSDPTKSTKDQLRQWTDKLSYHLWKCEDANSPGFWRCPCCGEMVQCGNPDPTDLLSADELEAIRADLVAHRNDCHEQTLVKLGLKAPQPEEEDDNTDDDSDEEPPPHPDDDDVVPIEGEVVSDGEANNVPQVPLFCPILSSHNLFRSAASKSSFGSGYLRLAVATRLAGARCAFRRLFCPICFFLSADKACQKAKREGDDDVRFKRVYPFFFLSQY